MKVVAGTQIKTQANSLPTYLKETNYLFFNNIREIFLNLSLSFSISRAESVENLTPSVFF